MVARSLPATWTVPWAWLFWLGWMAVNAAILAAHFEWIGDDWVIWRQAAEAVHSGGDPWSVPLFIYPPVTAWLMAFLVVPLGFFAIIVGHGLLLLVLARERLLLALFATSGSYWGDALGGSFVGLHVVTGVMALKGHRWAGIVCLASLILFPRPAFFPLAAWLLWKDARLRVPFLSMAVAVGAISLVSGQVDNWIVATLRMTIADFPWRQFDFGVTRFLGGAWLIVGIPLALWLTRKGWVGVAGMAMTPYLPYSYLMLPLLDAPKWRRVPWWVPVIALTWALIVMLVPMPEG